MVKLKKVHKQLGKRSRHIYQDGIRLGLTYGDEVYGIGWGDMLALHTGDLLYSNLATGGTNKHKAAALLDHTAVFGLRQHVDRSLAKEAALDGRAPLFAIRENEAAFGLAVAFCKFVAKLLAHFVSLSPNLSHSRMVKAAVGRIKRAS